jgi:class 3 adenylate cyclase
LLAVLNVHGGGRKAPRPGRPYPKPDEGNEMEILRIPPDLESKMKEEGVQIKSAAEMKKVSVLFVDVRNFSHLFQKHDPETILAIIDLYFRVLSSIVKKYDGIIPRISGGSLMAVWGLPSPQKIDSYNAVRAGVEMRMEMYHLVPELVRVGTVPLEIGIGIGTGKVISGFVGPLDRREFTLVGNCIIRGERLQSVAFDNRIFIDKMTAAEIKLVSYMMPLPKGAAVYGLKDEMVYEVEGIYEFNRKFEAMRKHPRFIVAKVVGLTKTASKQRKAVLLKSVGEGGLGIEIHEKEKFDLQIGERVVVDTSRVSLLGMKNVKGMVVRKEEYKADGIFHLKTWDVGIKLLDLSEETKKRLQKVAVGKRIV